MIKAVIFDLDNTLYSYNECHIAAIDKVYEYVKNEFNISKKEFLTKLELSKSHVKNNLNNVASSHNRILYFQDFLEKINVKSIFFADIMYDIYWNRFFDEMKLKPGLTEFLNLLKNNNILIGLCTDLTAYIQYKKIKKLKLENYIDYIVTSEEIGTEKPDKKMFDAILNKLKVTSSECIYIGDDPVKDIQGALNSNIESILIKNDYYEIIKYIERRIKNEKN